MPDQTYDYVLELWREADGIALGRVPVDVDLVPAREYLILDLLRRGVIQQPEGLAPMTVQPIWNTRTGAPDAIGFRATLAAPGGEAVQTFSINYFRPLARRAANKFVEQGELKEGETFEYCVMAFPRKSGAPASGRFSLTAREAPLPINPASLERLMAGSLLFGTANLPVLPVLYHWRVLQDASILTRRAGAMETGGVLVGHVCRDAGGCGELFLEISALIPAKGKGELTKLAFTPDIWTDVQAEVDRRDRNEIWLGWFHSHSFYHQCNTKTQLHDLSARRNAEPFFSEDDCRLHRNVFPRALSVALLVTDSPQSGMSWTTFGWHKGELASRPFHVIHAPLPSEFHAQGENHEAN
jgi:hypothetical protein